MRSRVLLVIGMLVACGCAGGGDLLAPVGTDPCVRPQTRHQASSSHSLWGLWEFRADPVAGTLEVVPFHQAAMHVNTVVLLEPPAGVRIKISNVTFDGTVCDVDVTLVHPFAGLSQYIGFDVAGILISKGTLSGFHDPDIVMSGPGDVRLLNPDGYTRWWNPVEFAVPGQPILRYRDGLLGVKHSVAGFTGTLNAYKFFAEGLDKDDDVLSLGPTTRAPFLHGAGNTRHYTIDFADGVVFNYAVDASWEMPEGEPPFSPDDYVPEANKPEAWAASITAVENSLFNDGIDSGGNLRLDIDVWDHFNAGLNTLWVDSPGSFDPVTVTTPIGGGDGYSTYRVDILDAFPKEGSIDILIGIDSEVIGYVDVLPDKPVTSYFVYTAGVSPTSQFGPVADLVATTPTDIDICEEVSFDASGSTGTPPLTFTWDFNGDAVYDGPGDEYTGDPITPTHEFTVMGTYSVTVKVSNAVGYDISDPVVVNVGLNPDGIYVDGDYTGGGSDGSQSKPFQTIQEGMSAASSGMKIHVDYLSAGNHIYDTAGLALKSGVDLLGDNWTDCSQPKPVVSCATSGRVLFGQDVSDVTIEGFEVIVPSGPAFSGFSGQPTLAGIDLKDSNANGGGGSTNDNTIRGCRFTGSVAIQAGYKAIFLEGAVGTLVELCEFGSLTGLSSSNFDIVNCVMQYRSDSSVIRKNWVHDLIGNAATGSGRVEVFRVLWSDDVEVTNNLMHSIQGQNGYCNIVGVYIDGQPGTASSGNPLIANNTIDDINTNGYGFANMVLFSNTIGGAFCIPNALVYNNIVSNTQGSASSRAYEFVQMDPSDPCYADFCNAYNTAWLAAGGAEGYLYIIKGTGSYGNWTDPQDPDYINPPDDYDLSATSTSQYGDPSFVDWDDTGSPSNNPDNKDPNTRSRMGAFGGPGGGWWPPD